MIWILGVQVELVLTGAPVAAAIALTRSAMKTVMAGFCPATDGQTAVSQRAILPVSLVGVVKALANLSSASRDLAAVTVTFSVGSPDGACADAATVEIVSAAEAASMRTVFLDISQMG